MGVGGSHLGFSCTGKVPKKRRQADKSPFHRHRALTTGRPMDVAGLLSYRTPQFSDNKCSGPPFFWRGSCQKTEVMVQGHCEPRAHPEMLPVHQPPAQLLRSMVLHSHSPSPPSRRENARLLMARQWWREDGERRLRFPQLWEH